MFTSEVKEIFDSYQSISYEGSYNIGTVCNHLGGTDFSTRRSNSARPFGFYGDPQDLILFSQILMSGSNIKDAMKHTGLSWKKARKLTEILNAASEAKGLPPVHSVIPNMPPKQIVCDQTGQVFPSMSEALRALKIKGGTISQHVKGDPRRRSIKGYTFSRGEKARSIEEYTKLLAPAGPRKKIICDQTGQVFPSMIEAVRIMKLHRGALTIHIKEPLRRKTVKGYTFSRGEKARSIEEYTKLQAPSQMSKPVEIICDQTGQSFPSIKAAARVMKVNTASLSQHVSGKVGFRTVKGYTFSKVNASQSSKASA